MIGMLAWRKVIASLESGLAPALPAAPTGDALVDGMLTVVVGVTTSVDPLGVVGVLFAGVLFTGVWFIGVLLVLRQEVSVLPATVIVPLHASSPTASSSES